MKKNDPSSQSAKKREEKKMYSIRVWDIPTRIFHWLLVGLVIFSFITGKIGLTTMKYHEWSGFAILVLVGFRLVWGFIGGQQSRFSTFVKGPAAVIRYASSLLSKDSKRVYRSQSTWRMVDHGHADFTSDPGRHRSVCQ